MEMFYNPSTHPSNYSQNHNQMPVKDFKYKEGGLININTIQYYGIESIPTQDHVKQRQNKTHF